MTAGESAESKGNENAGQLLVKRSNATKLWLGIVMSVLVVLWWQTHNQPSTGYNVFLNGDSQAVGAEVAIDGTTSGTMSRSQNSGLGGAIFYARLPNGHHLVEVKKPGYKTFRKEIDLRTKDYVSVELVSENGRAEDSEGI